MNDRIEIAKPPGVREDDLTESLPIDLTRLRKDPGAEAAHDSVANALLLQRFVAQLVGIDEGAAVPGDEDPAESRLSAPDAAGHAD
jgi:hypothetical protein